MARKEFTQAELDTAANNAYQAGLDSARIAAKNEPPKPTGRVWIRYNGLPLKCNTGDDEVYFAWLISTLRWILERGNNPATQLILEYDAPLVSIL